MSHKISVHFNGNEIKVKSGISILKILERYPHKGRGAAIGAIVNQRLMGLYRQVRSDCTVTTVDYHSKEGANIFRRSLAFILHEAFSELYPKIRLEIGQSLGKGYYYHVHGENGKLTEEMLHAVENKMTALVAAARPMKPTLVSTEEAIEYFQKQGYPEKALLLHHRRQPESSWVVMGEFRDIAHGPIVPNSAYCTDFALIPRLPGFVLNFPDLEGNVFYSLPHQPKLFETYREGRDWNERLGVWSVGHLNRTCIDGSISEVIRVAEGFQEKKIANLADMIHGKRENVRLVLIAGPSSSGKTTFTKRLAVQLLVNGIRPVMLSMDNYYVNRVDTPKNPDGSYDYECVEALDLPLFNEDLARLMDGDEIKMPSYDFVTGKRRANKFTPVNLGKKEVLIVEGIHGLNPRLTESVDASMKFRINVSALTQLCIDEHNRLFTSDTRLLRRIVRDRLFRGYSAKQTIEQWPHVREGEKKYIFPFQEEADVLFDTSLVYEHAVLRPYLQRFLIEVDQRDASFVEAYRLLNFLALFIPVFPEEVPPTSILREFIGGSTFEY